MDTAKLVAVKAVSAGDGAVAFHEADLPQPYRSAPALLEALRPLAALLVPAKPQGNAGAYSIRHSDIERARAAIAAATGEK